MVVVFTYETVRESIRYQKEQFYKLAWKLDVIW